MRRRLLVALSRWKRRRADRHRSGWDTRKGADRLAIMINAHTPARTRRKLP